MLCIAIIRLSGNLLLGAFQVLILRAVVVRSSASALPFLRVRMQRTQASDASDLRFSTSGHPIAGLYNKPGACYVASWQLPRPDLHRLADDDFSGHTTLC